MSAELVGIEQVKSRQDKALKSIRCLNFNGLEHILFIWQGWDSLHNIQSSKKSLKKNSQFIYFPAKIRMTMGKYFVCDCVCFFWVDQHV
ncbi:hypothetical protein NIES208_04510 [[Limnothrix rosea] IAM M-220]|nr:hypothetical protein NIES208_04510 [[Limnothrix rosea] IAM M-220]